MRASSFFMKYFCLISLVFISSFGYSQSYKVTVVDENNIAIPFVATEIIYSVNSEKKSKQTITNGNGLLFIDTAWKEVRLRLKHISYQTKFTSVSAINNKVTLYLDQTELTDFVVTGQYAPSSDENTSHKVRVIDSKRIEAQGAVTLQELMEQEMNIRVSQDNVLGASMSVQGLSGENVKILIDGVPVVGRLNGSVDLSQINLNNIERVEIVEGPLSVSYGTNALAGTINLITKKNKKKFGGNVDAYYETIGQYNLNGRVDLALKSHSFSFSLGRNFFDGYSQLDTSRVMEWKPKEQVFGNFKYSNTYKKISYDFTSDIFNEKLESRGGPRQPYKEFAFDDYFKTNRYSNALNFRYTPNKNSSVNVLGGYNYYNRIKNRYLKDLVNVSYELVNAANQQDTSVFDLIFSRGTYSFAKDSSKINFQLGYDINVESNRGRRITDGEKQIGDYAVFGSMEYRPSRKTIIRPGIRYAYNTAYKAPIIPSLNIRHQFTKHMTTRFSWGRGFRAPSLKELHFLFVDINHNIAGNSDLLAEKSDNLMFQMTYKRGIKRGVYNFDLSGFYNSVQNQISLALVDQASQLYTYTNIGKFYSQGLNFNSGFRYKTYKTNFGASWTGRYNIESDGNPQLQKFFYTPEIMASFGYEVESWQATFNLFYKYTGKVLGYFESELDGVTQYELDSYNMMDFTVIKYFFDKKLNVTLGAKNIFDIGTIQSNQAIGGGVHTAGSNNIPVAWGRTYFTRVAYNF